jgi:transposase
MVYTPPSKVAQIVELKNIGQSDYEIAHRFNLHCTTIPRLIKWFSESGDPYFRKHKPGHPRKLQEHDARHGAILLAQTEAANVTELTKKAFPHVSRITVSWALHQYGLVSRVRRSKPWISPANVAKRKAWAAAHAGWTVEDWKQVIFSDESKFMLFKSDGCQYCWMKPGQALDPCFTKKTIKHGGGNVMVWGCITGEGMGRLHHIEGIMNGPGYVDILQQSLLGTLKDQKLKKTAKTRSSFSRTMT